MVRYPIILSLILLIIQTKDSLILINLGDSGYPLRQWLITPITNPNNEAEEYFNTAQMACRSIIERCNGVLKQRFRFVS